MAAKNSRTNWAVVVLFVTYGLAAFFALTRPGATMSSDERKVITLSHWQIETGPRKAIDAVIRRYEELNPGVRVEQIAVPDRLYKQWLRTQLIGGTAPDIIEFGHFFGGVDDIPPRFFKTMSDLVEKPNPYNKGSALEETAWRNTFLDGLNTGDTYIENLNGYYAVTLCVLGTRLFYNPELLEKITGRAQMPDHYRDMPPLADRLASYNEKTGQRISLYAGSKFNGRMMMERMLSRPAVGLNIGADRLREQGMQARDLAVEYLRGGWDYRRPELLSGLALMRQVATGMRPGYQQLDREAALQEFLSGRAMMILTGTWDATALKTMAPFKVGITEFPWPTVADGADGRYAWSPISEGAAQTTMAMYLNKESAHPEEAVDFLHFITSIEGNTIFFRESGWLPSIREVEVPESERVFLPRFDGYPIRASFLAGFGSETRELWQWEMHHLISAKGGVDQFLDSFSAKFSDALRRDLLRQTQSMALSIRHELPVLVAMSALERLQQQDSKDHPARIARESNQNIAEARLYEARAGIRLGREIEGSVNRTGSREN